MSSTNNNTIELHRCKYCLKPFTNHHNIDNNSYNPKLLGCLHIICSYCLLQRLIIQPNQLISLDQSKILKYNEIIATITCPRCSDATIIKFNVKSNNVNIINSFTVINKLLTIDIISNFNNNTIINGNIFITTLDNKLNNIITIQDTNINNIQLIHSIINNKKDLLLLTNQSIDKININEDIDHINRIITIPLQDDINYLNGLINKLKFTKYAIIDIMNINNGFIKSDISLQIRACLYDIDKSIQSAISTSSSYTTLIQSIVDEHNLNNQNNLQPIKKFFPSFDQLDSAIDTNALSSIDTKINNKEITNISNSMDNKGGYNEVSKLNNQIASESVNYFKMISNNKIYITIYLLNVIEMSLLVVYIYSTRFTTKKLILSLLFFVYLLYELIYRYIDKSLDINLNNEKPTTELITPNKQSTTSPYTSSIDSLTYSNYTANDISNYSPRFDDQLHVNNEISMISDEDDNEHSVHNINLDESYSEVNHVIDNIPSTNSSNYNSKDTSIYESNNQIYLFNSVTNDLVDTKKDDKIENITNKSDTTELTTQSSLKVALKLTTELTSELPNEKSNELCDDKPIYLTTQISDQIPIEKSSDDNLSNKLQIDPSTSFPNHLTNSPSNSAENISTDVADANLSKEIVISNISITCDSTDTLNGTSSTVGQHNDQITNVISNDEVVISRDSNNNTTSASNNLSDVIIVNTNPINEVTIELSTESINYISTIVTKDNNQLTDITTQPSNKLNESIASYVTNNIPSDQIVTNLTIESFSNLTNFLSSNQLVNETSRYHSYIDNINGVDTTSQSISFQLDSHIESSLNTTTSSTKSLSNKSKSITATRIISSTSKPVNINDLYDDSDLKYPKVSAATLKSIIRRQDLTMKVDRSINAKTQRNSSPDRFIYKNNDRNADSNVDVRSSSTNNQTKFINRSTNEVITNQPRSSSSNRSIKTSTSPNPTRTSRLRQSNANFIVEAKNKESNRYSYTSLLNNNKPNQNKPFR